VGIGLVKKPKPVILWTVEYQIINPVSNPISEDCGLDGDRVRRTDRWNRLSENISPDSAALQSSISLLGIFAAHAHLLQQHSYHASGRTFNIVQFTARNSLSVDTWIANTFSWVRNGNFYAFTYKWWWQVMAAGLDNGFEKT